MSELKYVIFDFSEADKINFNEVKEDSIETLRKSVDGNKTFVKYEGVMPECVNDLLTKSREYYNFEILEILATEEWTNSELNRL
jgi:hypothetical protein